MNVEPTRYHVIECLHKKYFLRTSAPEQGRGYQATELGVPLIAGAEFLRCLDAVIGGPTVDTFVDPSAVEDQFTLF